MTPRPYAGPIEVLPAEEWAVRFRITPEHFRKIYTGRWTYVGLDRATLPRIYSGHLHDWLDAGGAEAIAQPGSWDGVGETGGEAIGKASGEISPQKRAPRPLQGRQDA